jgi:hypothetical protein
MITPARSLVLKAHYNRLYSLKSNAFAKLGYIPDHLAVRYAQQDSREVLTSGTSSENSLANFRYPTLDQGNSGSCTFHGTPQALYVSAAAVGRPLPFFPSPFIGYGVVRILELADANQSLTDSGAMPSDLITVVNKWGIAPIGFGGQHPTPDGRNSDIWTFADTGDVSQNVLDKPSFLDLETSGLVLPIKPLRVDETSSDFGGQLKAAVDGKIAGGVGIFVDVANFMQWNPANGPIKTIDTSDPQGGGHWLEFDYYYTFGSELVVGGANSWGDSWPAGNSNGSPFFRRGGWEMTLSCLQSVCSDCLLFPAVAA